jgi:hypothetical protein
LSAAGIGGDASRCSFGPINGCRFALTQPGISSLHLVSALSLKGKACWPYLQVRRTAENTRSVEQLVLTAIVLRMPSLSLTASHFTSLKCKFSSKFLGFESLCRLINVTPFVSPRLPGLLLLFYSLNRIPFASAQAPPAEQILPASPS